MNHEKRMVKIVVGDGSPFVTFKPGQNSKCRCGSGKKSKHCCGDEANFYSTKPKHKPMTKTDGDGNTIEV